MLRRPFETTPRYRTGVCSEFTRVVTFRATKASVAPGWFSANVPAKNKTARPIARIVLRQCLSASVDRKPVFRLDDHVPRISFMKCSIFFVTRARSGPRFCCKQLPQKNVMMRSASNSLSPASPRAAVRLSIRSSWAFVILAIMIRRALGGRSANSRMEFTEKHPFCPQLP